MQEHKGQEHEGDEIFDENDLKALGIGAFGQTFRATVINPHLAKKWGKVVAFKRPKGDAEQADVMKDIVNMARIQGVIQGVSSVGKDEGCDHLLRFHDCVQYKNEYVMVCEYIEGTDLKDKLEEFQRDPSGGLTLQETIECMIQVCKALSVLHRAGVYHRDVKPSNILLKEGQGGIHAVLADFGLSTIRDSQNLDVSNSTWGAIAYMPPEIVAGSGFGVPLCPACDLYSVGMVLYQLCCGRFPYDDSNLFSSAVDVMDFAKPFRNPREFAPQLPESLCRVIMKAIEKRQDVRYQSAGEMIEDLSQVQKEIQEGASPQSSDSAVLAEIDAVEAKLEQESPGLVSTELLLTVEGGLVGLFSRYPTVPEVCVNLGQFYRKWRRDASKTRETFEKGLEYVPKSSILLYHLGEVILSQRRVEPESRQYAVHCLRQALEYGLPDQARTRVAEKHIRANARKVNED